MNSVISKNKKTITLENGEIFIAEKPETVADFMGRVRKEVKENYLEDLAIDKETAANKIVQGAPKSMEDSNKDAEVKAEEKSAAVKVAAEAKAEAVKVKAEAAKVKAEEAEKAIEAKKEAKAKADAEKVAAKAKADAEKVEAKVKADAEKAEAAEAKAKALEAKKEAKEKALKEKAEVKAKLRAEEEATKEAEEAATKEAEEAEMAERLVAYEKMLDEKREKIATDAKEESDRILAEAQVKVAAMFESKEADLEKFRKSGGDSYDPVLLELAKSNKGKKCSFVPFGLVDAIEGVVVGAGADKRSNSVYYRIHDEFSILYHKNAKTGGVKFLED